MFYRGYLRTKDIDVEVEYLEGSVRAKYNRWDFFKRVPTEEMETFEQFLRKGAVEWDIPTLLKQHCISSYLETKAKVKTALGEVDEDKNVKGKELVYDRLYGDIVYYEKVKEAFTVRNRYFGPEEKLKDEFGFTSDGNVREMEYKSLDGKYYMYEVTINGKLYALQYKIEGEVDLSISRYGTEVKALKEIDGFTYRDIITNKSDIDMSNLNIRDMSYLTLIKDLTWQQYKDYKVITDVAEFHKVCDEMEQVTGFIGFDTETTGIDLNDSPNSDKIVGIVLSYKDDQSYYIPIMHNKFDNIPLADIILRLKPILENKKIVTTNGGFECKAVRPLGIRPNIVLDLFTIIYLTDHSHYGVRRNLEIIVKKNYSIDTLALDDIFVNEIMFQELPIETVRAYACPDADLTRKACIDLIKNLPQDSYAILAEDIACMVNISIHSEHRGVKLNEELVYQLDEWNTEDLKKLERLAWRIAGDWEFDKQFDLTSDAQIYNIMYNELDYPKIVLMKDNPDKASTAKRALKELMNVSLSSPITRLEEDILHENPEEKEPLISADKLNNMAHPLAYIISQHRKFSKLQSTFYTALKKACKENNGYYYPHYNMFVAETGRIISVIQQMVKSLRKVFVCEDDYYWITADYAQVEYRLMAILSQSEDIIKGLRDPETDAHTLSASIVHQVPMEQVTDTMRSDGKIWSFAVPYGVGDYAACELMFKYPITEDKLRQTRLSKAKYLEGHHKVDEYLTQAKEYAYQNGYIKTKGGRYRYFTYELTSGDDYLYNTVANKAGNLPIQGFAADEFKMAFNNLCERIERESKTNSEFKKVFIPFLVHDEYNILVPKTIHPYQMVKILREELEIDLSSFGFKHVAPLFIGISIIDNWGEGKFDEYELPVAFTDKVIQEVNEGKHTEYVERPKDKVFKDVTDFISNAIYNDLVQAQPDLTPSTLQLETLENYHRLFMIKKAGQIFKLTNDQKAEIKKANEKDEPRLKKIFSLANALAYYFGEEVEIERPSTEKEENPFLVEDDDDGGEGYQVEETVFNLKEYRKLKEQSDLILDDLYFEDTSEPLYLTDFNPKIKPVGKRLFLEVTGTKVAEFQKLNEYIKSIHYEYGRYRVVYVWGEETITTDFRLARVPYDELDELLPKQIKQKEIKTVKKNRMFS